VHQSVYCVHSVIMQENPIERCSSVLALALFSNGLSLDLHLLKAFEEFSDLEVLGDIRRSVAEFVFYI
jgi:hypothetical protein